MHPDARRADGYRHDLCELCFLEQKKLRSKMDKRKYRADPDKQTKEKYRSWQLKRYYGITSEEFDTMLENQGYACAACGSKDSRWAKGWCVDHNHTCCESTPTCGKCVRGILCMPCNMAAGVMKDNIRDLLALVEYLKGKNYTPPNLGPLLRG